jgi:hypothetical protein
MINLPRLDPDDAGDARLRALVARLHPDDVRPFVEKLTTQSLPARFHTYRELLAGIHLRDRGFDVRYERDIGKQTPDWALMSAEGTIIEILDVVTLHQRYEKDAEIREAVRTSGQWSGWITIPPDHIYRKLSDKARQYSRTAKDLNLPYVLAVFGDFTASISPEDMRHVLYEQHDGWFKTAPEVSGLIYFRESALGFEYSYYVNRYAALRSVMLPTQGS